ncbi:hypothetical protein [Roseovarius sp. MMSF_3281]|uniref:hypothetical protein n=1 Tax=Roseovarius sp. MMSF_3281 TaxID=3046694 RepID=UPI00273DCC61|nr:hypothetical protein [Roseovarius sp. MMSF_3281]
MHTVLVILGGLGLLTLIYGIALWRGRSLRRAFPVYAVLWAVAAAINLWVGVAHAGYSLAEEFPIFVVVFGVPCAIAWLLAWRSA